MPVLALSAVFIAIGWVSLFLFAPETVACERLDDGRPRCELSRRFAFVTLRDRVLDGIQAVSLEESRSQWRSPQRPGGTTYWIRYYYRDTESVDGTTANGSEENQAVVNGVRQFLADPDTRRYEATLPGSRVAVRVMPWLLGFGVLGVVNAVITLGRARVTADGRR